MKVQDTMSKSSKKNAVIKIIPPTPPSPPSLDRFNAEELSPLGKITSVTSPTTSAAVSVVTDYDFQKNLYKDISNSIYYRIKCHACPCKFYPRDMKKHCQTMHQLDERKCTWCHTCILHSETMTVLTKKDAFYWKHMLGCFKTKYLLATLQNDKETKIGGTCPITHCFCNDDDCENFLIRTTGAAGANSPDKHLTNLNEALSSTIIPTLFANNHNRPSWLTNTDSVHPGHVKDFHNKFEWDKRTNIDSFFIRAYMLKHNLEWFHMAIEIAVWDKFEKYILKQLPQLYILPYTTDCAHRLTRDNMHHRHIIVVGPKKTAFFYLMQLSNKLNENRTAFSNFIRRITKPTGLIERICKLCELNGRCRWVDAHNDEMEEYEAEDVLDAGNGKYLQVKPRFELIPYASILMALLTKHGLESLVKRFLNKRNPYELKTLSQKVCGSAVKYVAMLIELLEHVSIILPIPRDCELSDNESSQIADRKGHIFIGNQKRLYCSQNLSLVQLSSLEWNSYQAQHRGMFPANIGVTKMILPQEFQRNLSHGDAKIMELSTINNYLQKLSDYSIVSSSLLYEGENVDNLQQQRLRFVQHDRNVV